MNNVDSPQRVSGSDVDVDHPWEDDNQAWWDWYVSLAENEQPGQPLVEVAPLPDIAPAGDAEVIAELRRPFPMQPADRRKFASDGYVKVKGVLSPAVVLRLRAELVALLEDRFATRLDGGTKERFLSLEMVWLENDLLREFVLSPRIAGICADLLGVAALRLYHDNVLSKEPGCGRTPWHFDDHHFPLDTQDVVTAWVPAQPVPQAMGPLAFAAPLGVHRLVEHIPFNKTDASYDRGVDEVFRAEGVTIDDTPFELGEVSFHHNLCFHAAAGNRTTRSRVVMANTYYADGARVVDRPTMVSGDWQKFLPGVEPGGVAASRLNPVCWPVE